MFLSIAILSFFVKCYLKNVGNILGVVVGANKAVSLRSPFTRCCYDLNIAGFLKIVPY